MVALQEQIKKGVKILKAGRVVAFPTDTVYGLGADFSNSKSVEKIYEVKKRSKYLPLPLLVNDISQMRVLAATISQLTLFLARRFWPGGLTLILPKAASLPLYPVGQPTVAVRVPAHPVPLALIQGLGKPIIGTSANISGNLSASTAGEVEQQLGDRVDFIIDGGQCPGGSKSTIVDATGETPVILRQGIISQYEIEQAFEEYRKVNNYAYCSGV